jgi:RNA polymerase sigma-70 factor (ECF subfamily)
MEENSENAQLMNVDNEIDRLAPQSTPPSDGDNPQLDVDRVDVDQVDNGLLDRIARGDGRAFHQLVDRHSGRLYRVAFSLVGNVADAEDVLQEAFAGVFRGAGKFEGRSSVQSWMTRIVVTQAAKFWRTRRGKRDKSLEENLEASTGPAVDSGGSASVDARLDLQSCLQQLSEEHRQVLVLREIDGMGYEEIAQVLSVPRGTVESRLFRARAELKKKLKDYLP